LKVRLLEKKAGKVKIEVVSVNDKAFGKPYSKYLVNSLVKIDSRKNGGNETAYTLSVTHDDDAYSVKDF
jgi:hypothetical protein